MDVGLEILGILFFVAMAAGFIDSIAGGGGFLTLPVLLLAGLSPEQALATNKGQSVFGSALSVWRYRKASLIDTSRFKVHFWFGFLGSICGAALVIWLKPEALKPLILILLTSAAIFFVVHPKPRPAKNVSRSSRLKWAGLIALVLGAYDGFFGPGTGSFLIYAMVLFLGDDFQRASANAKVVNFASNLSSAIIFYFKGWMIYPIVGAMAIGQLIGARLGTQWVIKKGQESVRRVVIAVSLLMAVRLALSYFGIL